MKIAVIGGGNIGTLMAVEMAAKGHQVVMYTSKPEIWSNNLEAYDAQENLVFSGLLADVTSDLAAAVADADYVWITYPTFMLEGIAQQLLPLVEEGQHIGVVPGNDAEFFFSEHVNRGAVLFGLQRVHSIARLKERGKSVYMLGRKSEIQVAALPSENTSAVAQVVGNLFDLPCVELPHYLVETLTPSNPILHTTRIYTMFRDWHPGVYYDRNFLFYEEWTDESSDMLLACDDELQMVCRRLEELLGINLEQVRSLRLHYESPDSRAMTKKLSGIAAFKGLTSPMKEEGEGKWVPDFDSRYFVADFSFGMKAIMDIARCVGVPTPNMDVVYGWYVDTAAPQLCFEGVPDNLDDLAKLYK